MAINTNCWVNPKLEELRNSKPPAESTEAKLTRLKRLAKIHAGYLFTKESHSLLKTLCLRLSATRPTRIYPGWKEFGLKLNLNPLIIQTITCNFHLEDPTYYILMAYAQNENASLETILQVLYEIERYDVISEIEELFKEFYESITSKYNGHTRLLLEKPTELLNLLHCPFILKNSDELKNQNEIYLQPKALQITPQASPVKSRYAKTALITYAEDANEIVKQCLKSLRKPRDSKRLGVVVLNEQLHKITVDPKKFVFDCFTQVDYIFPVITQGYINILTGVKDCSMKSIFENSDHKYVKYIYSLMSTSYCNNSCKNSTVRCIIPDDILMEVLPHPIMVDLLFQVWVTVNDIDKMMNVILQ